MNRRELIQLGALAAGGRMMSPAMLLAQPGVEPASLYITEERIAATPAFFYRPYRSRAAAAADQLAWVQIDLGATQHVEEIRLYPANERMVYGVDAYYGGEGFPLRFRLELAEDAGFSKPVLIADHTHEDFPNPSDRIVAAAGCSAEGRYLRLTVTKMPQPQWTNSNVGSPTISPAESAKGKYWFALSKISVMRDGRDVALGAVVTADSDSGEEGDLRQLTRPERIETEYVRRDRPEYVTAPASWKRVPYAAHAPTSGVTLHGGVFESTMRKNIAYLLSSFDTDDLLLQFRERAGKPVPASDRTPDKFWESDLAGSNAGRFLMGAGNTLRWIDDSKLRKRFDAVIAGIAECSQPDGYMMAYPKDSIFYSERGAYTRAWLTHGLIDAGYAGNKQAFELLRGYYDWFNQCPYLPTLMRGAVQGGQGMIANTRMYHTSVGKPEDIQIIQRHFLEAEWLQALAHGDEKQVWQYPYDRPHCYLLTNLEAYLDVYMATGDKRWHDGVLAAWEMYNRHWEQPGGSISIIEYHEDPPSSNSLTQQLGELCGSSFWVFLSQRFQLMNPGQEQYATEIEKSIYNVAMANQDGDHGLRYHTVLVGKKEKGTRINTCCEGQGTRLIGSLPEHIYSVAPDGIYVNLFEPSSLQCHVSGKTASIRMETAFPFDNKVRLTINGHDTVTMKIRIRVPSWSARNMNVTVNGTKGATGQPGSFLTLERTWAPGDQVSFVLQPEFKLEEYTGIDQIPGKKRYSITYGPVLYAATGSRDVVLQAKQGASINDLAGSLKPKAGTPLHFTVDGDQNTVLMPYWQVDQEEFTCFPVVQV